MQALEVLHVAEVRNHFLLQIGPCLAMLGFVEDSPVGGGPLGHPEQGCRRVGVGCFIGPTQGVFHTVDTVTPFEDGKRILVFLNVEDWNFPLVDLHNWVRGGSSHWSDGDTST